MLTAHWSETCYISSLTSCGNSNRRMKAEKGGFLPVLAEHFVMPKCDDIGETTFAIALNQGRSEYWTTKTNENDERQLW